VPNLALFDFDGTITVADTFTPFIYFAVDPARLRLGKVLLAPIIAAYKLKLIRASLARASIVKLGFWGKEEVAVRQLGSTYSREKVRAVVRPKALERLLWHQARGDTVVIVSASLEVYLSDWCDQLGFDLIATQLESRSGLLTGRYLHGDCTRSEKARRICQRYDLKSYQVVYAYGDTKDEEAMLALAHKKYFRWRETIDLAATVAADDRGDPNNKRRLREIDLENANLERLVAEQERTS